VFHFRGVSPSDYSSNYTLNIVKQEGLGKNSKKAPSNKAAILNLTLLISKKGYDSPSRQKGRPQIHGIAD
jgi:hypothetical protein